MFVTLLLIPAILVCGTSVDLARVFAAKSIVQDANQLGANSVLASYDALLQDLYGLYGVMKSDPEFAALADQYIKLTLLTDDGGKDLGTFQLFYGSNLVPGEVVPAEQQNLNNVDVLRRQIEEYSKFRAPVIIMEQVVEKLGTFQKVRKDAEIIKDKMEIEDRIEEIEEKYKDIYDKIQEVNRCGDAEDVAVSQVNSYLSQIQDQLNDLYDTRDSWTSAYRDDNDEEMGDWEKKYNGILKNIKALVRGGTIRTGWIPGNVTDTGAWSDGYWMDSTEEHKGLKRYCEDMQSALDGYSDELNALKGLCKEAGDKKRELSQQVDELEAKLNSGECSDDLKQGMTVTKDETGKTMLERYRALLGYDLEPMAQAMLEADLPQINAMKDLLDPGAVVYGRASVGETYSLDRLASLESSIGFSIDLIVTNESLGAGARYRDDLYYITSVTPDRYSVPGTYWKFQDHRFASTKNPEFYQMLEKFFSSGGGESKKKSITKGLTKMLGTIQNQFKTFLEFDPAGAWHYSNGSDDHTSDDSAGFGSEGDWNDDNAAKNNAKEALENSGIISQLGDMLSDAADKILLLTYDSEMFSCYSTPDKEEDGEEEKTMSGIPLGIDVNYYFQSELEYLYHGNLQDAKSNLVVVTGMLFLVRFVFNYVASFSIDEVNYIVNLVKSALAATGPFAVVGGELARLVMALGESAMDVGRLKDGDRVRIVKDDNTWKFSLRGLITEAGDVLEMPSSALDNSAARDDDSDPALSYKDYMRLFLLLVDGNTLAQRTARLIELNVTNKRDGIGNNSDRSARETAMANAELFKMSDAVTGFSLTTKLDLKMLFLSMPYAQEGIDGVVPPGTLPLSVTDHRGY